MQDIVNKVTEEELTKLYYSIGEVSRMFNVNTSLIRFWHKEFDIIQPKINKKGNRLFTPKDILNFDKIYQLVKVQGFTLEGAKKALKKKKTKENQSEFVRSVDTDQLVSTLEMIKSKLLQLKSR